MIARGKTLYEIHCRLCHGADLRGGEQGGSNAPETYLVDGRQHVLIAVGDTLYAFTLY